MKYIIHLKEYLKKTISSPSRKHLNRILASIIFFQENSFPTNMNISASHRSIDKGHLVKTFSKKYGDLYGSFTKRGRKK